MSTEQTDDQKKTLTSPYATVIDLSTKAQRERSQEHAQKTLKKDDEKVASKELDELPDIIQQAAKVMRWTELMDVQKQAIPYILNGRDLIVQSRTGSGKTGAFLLPLFKLLNPSEKKPQALIITPTRELARQVHEEFEQMKAATPETFEFDAALLYGGVKYGPQIRALKQGAQVVIGTPGRTLDHLNKGNLSLDALKALVIDEADEMLSMGFYPDMMKIREQVPENRQSYLFSATIPPKVRSLGDAFLTNPQFISLSSGHISVETIDHRFCVVDRMEKDRALVQIIEWENPDSAIIFANTRREVEYLSTFLQNYGHNAAPISGDLSQKDREKAMDRIREGSLRFLVATDVAARGIDISELSHVIQYDVPEDPDIYIHRSGRTARAGASGTAITLIGFDERFRIEVIERDYGIDFSEWELPSEEKIGKRVAERVVDLLGKRFKKKARLEQERIERSIPTVEYLAEERPELLAMLVDEVYHPHLHQQNEEPPKAEKKAKSRGRRGKKGRGRRGRGRRNR